VREDLKIDLYFLHARLIMIEHFAYAPRFHQYYYKDDTQRKYQISKNC